MAPASGTPKFPAPIPNPLAAEKSKPPEDSQSFVGEDDGDTDPNIAYTPSTAPTPSSTTQPKATTPPSATPPSAAATVAATATSTTPMTPPPPKIRMPEMGPLDSFMKDPTVSEIMVNDLRNVMLEKEGKMQFSGFHYSSIDELNRLTRAILDITGRILSPDSPYVDAMLPDGSRVNIVGPPLTIYGPCITIRKFPTRRTTVQDLIANEAMDQRIAYFLNGCVIGKINILICGGTGSGKTTFLNVLSSFIPKGERLITIEDTPELSISHFNSVRLQTKPATPTSPAITARDLVANSLRMRPDRIIVGECRRSEAFDMLQAMNTGHAGSMTTLHANTPRDGLARLETLCLLAGADIPIGALRKQIASAIDLIVQIKRFRNGKRRVVAITEVTGMEGDTITLQDLFQFDLGPNGAEGQESGAFTVLGMVPTFLNQLHEYGIDFPQSFFGN